MKRILLFAMICVAATACDRKENPAPVLTEREVYTVPYRKLTSIPTAGAELKVDLREVADSRCPKDVICVQMGTAKIKFNVSDASNQTEVNLEFKNDKKADFQEFRLGDHVYVLSVSDLLPYPVSTQTPNIEDYKVSVNIMKK